MSEKAKDPAEVAHDLLHEWWEESTETRALAFDDNTALLTRIRAALDAARREAFEEAMRICSAYASEAEQNGQHEKMYAANGLWTAIRERAKGGTP